MAVTLVPHDLFGQELRSDFATNYVRYIRYASYLNFLVERLQTIRYQQANVLNNFADNQ